MKEIKIKCANCGYVYIYYRDNTLFYLRLFGLSTVSFAVGWMVGVYC